MAGIGIPTLVFYILAVSVSCIQGEATNESITVKPVGRTIGGPDASTNEPKTVKPEGRIIGGQDAMPNEFPHQVLLLQRGGNGGTLCGASLISTEWILTAAHCATLKPGWTWTVTAGRHSGAEIPSSDPAEQASSPKEIFIHPCYNKSDEQTNNDIALMKLDKPFTLNDKVKTIQLDEKDRAKPCTETIALGWGRINPSTTQNAAVLKKATLNLPAAGFCNQNVFHLDGQDQSQQCLNETDSVCSGDSGGPLLCKDGGVNYVCGIASYVRDLSCIDGYNVFVRVYYYLNWIKEVMGSGRNSRTNCVVSRPRIGATETPLSVCSAPSTATASTIYGQPQHGLYLCMILTSLLFTY